MEYTHPQNPFGFAPFQRPRWNACAVLGFVLTFLPVLSIAGFVLCIVGFAQCGRGGGRGRGLALAGILINALWFVAAVMLLYRIGINLMEDLSAFMPYFEEKELYQFGYTVL